MKIKILRLLFILICLSFAANKNSNLLNKIDKSKPIEKTVKIYPPVIEKLSSVKKSLLNTVYSERGAGIGSGCNFKIIIKGCGQGFRVSLFNEITGEPYDSSISYQIYTMAWSIADYGFIEHDENTSWVLSPCTEYRVLFFPPKCPTEPIMITAVTDGCGGIFTKF